MRFYFMGIIVIREMEQEILIDIKCVVENFIFSKFLLPSHCIVLNMIEIKKINK